MLINPTVNKIQELRLYAMAKAFKDQLECPEINELSFEERLSLLIDSEMTARDSRRMKARLRSAKLQQTACLEDVDYYAARDLNKSLLTTLAQCQWVASHQNISIVGPTGTGKTFLACALAHKACLFGYTASYCRLPRLLPELQMSKGDGQYSKRIKSLLRPTFLSLMTLVSLY